MLAGSAGPSRTALACLSGHISAPLPFYPPALCVMLAAFCPLPGVSTLTLSTLRPPDLHEPSVIPYPFRHGQYENWDCGIFLVINQHLSSPSNTSLLLLRGAFLVGFYFFLIQEKLILTDLTVSNTIIYYIQYVSRVIYNSESFLYSS